MRSVQFVRQSVCVQDECKSKSAKSYTNQSRVSKTWQSDKVVSFLRHGVDACEFAATRAND